MFERSTRFADMSARQRLLNLNRIETTPARRRSLHRVMFEVIGIGAAAWVVFVTGLWLVL